MKLLKRMKIEGSRGFTLIELLVVIAIIGILSSIVLASLNTARSKGANAAIKADLANLRAQAEIYYDISQTYAGSSGQAFALAACPATVATANGTIFADANIQQLLNGAFNAYGSSASTNSRCYSSATGWFVAMTLKVPEGPTGNLAVWCVDSKGNSYSKAALPSTGTDCTY